MSSFCYDIAMKSGEEYERLSQEVVQALNHGKTATHNVKILGKLTEVRRQIDVKLDENKYDFVMYECKDWGKSIGVAVVGQMLTDLEDVGAKRGAIISNSPFTKGAINLATKKGVDLLHLVKTDNPKAKIGIAVKVLVRNKVIEAAGYALEDSSLNGGRIDFNPNTLVVIEDRKQYGLEDLARKRWNEGVNATAKIGKNVIRLNNPTVLDINGQETTMTKIELILQVKESYSEGAWVVKEAQGFYNVLDGSFHAYGNMKSEILSVKEMQDTFKPLSSDRVNQSAYSIILDVTSQYS